MSAHIKTRPFKTGLRKDARTQKGRPREPWRIVITNASRNGQPLQFTAADRAEMMREREVERWVKTRWPVTRKSNKAGEHAKQSKGWAAHWLQHGVSHGPTTVRAGA